MEVEAQKRKRGRPRKYPVSLHFPVVEYVEIQPQKCNRTLPSSVPSPLPEEEEERAGRGEEREEEMGAEDGEMKGRPYDCNPTWHPGDFGTLSFRILATLCN